MKCKTKGSVTTCLRPGKGSVEDRTFSLHANKDNKRSKAARGKALHRKFACTRHKSGKLKGKFKECHAKRG
jgi:hypothetical protein